MAHNLNPDRQTNYGINVGIQQALAAKYNPQNAKEALEWVKKVSGVDFAIPAVPQAGDVQAALKSGVALCELMNKIQPGSIKQINKMNMPFMQRENLSQFNAACQAYGLRSTDVFVTQDLYDGDNINSVIDCLFSLSGLAKSKGFKDATIGVAGAGNNNSTDNFKFEVKATGDTGAVTKQTMGSSATQDPNHYQLGLRGQIQKTTDVGATGAVSKQNAGSVEQKAEQRMDNINRLGHLGNK